MEASVRDFRLRAEESVRTQDKLMAQVRADIAELAAAKRVLATAATTFTVVAEGQKSAAAELARRPRGRW